MKGTLPFTDAQDFKPFGKHAMKQLNQFRRLLLTAILASQLAMVAMGQVAYVNFEGKQTNPVRLSPDGSRLFAVNTPDARLSVFDVSNPGNPVLIAESPVGIEPVSVNPRSNDEAWVVNEVSDSVSIVSVARGIVTDTLQAKDEPCDVVFAAGRAFVSCSRNNLIRVLDCLTHAELAAIPVAGLNPRALAVSPNGTKVYAAFALSGNRTTIIPHALAPPQPPPINITNPPPEVSLIVDATDTNWSHVIKYTMPDNDVVEIDATTLTVIRYFPRVGTVNLGLAVHPVSGDVFVANTDARNLVRFEPSVRGHVVDNRVSRIAVGDGTVTAFDLNPGIDYNTLPNPSALATALAQPTALTFDAAGNALYVAAFGTDRIARLDTNGNVLSRIEVGPATGAIVDPRTKRGPRGLALTPNGQHLYVLNRIANTLTVIGAATETILRELPLGSYDPTPVAIRSGRGFLYDAKLSGNGTVSCASCHVDAEMDMLAWDLGDPGGPMQTLTVATSGTTTGQTQAHPMKGPMTTQTLRGLKGLEPLHWRGDRATFLNFNPAFAALLGGQQLSSQDMLAYKTFVETIIFPPNPQRNLDNSLPQALVSGDPRAGDSFFRTTPFAIPNFGSVRCIDCHSHATGVEARANFRVGGAAPPLDILQPTKIPQLRSLYQKIHFDNSPGAESRAGYGFEHDGVKAGLAQAQSGPRFVSIENNATVINNLTAFLLCFDTGTAPAVGYTRTVNADIVNDPAVTNDWNILENQPAANCGLVIKGTLQGMRHGFLLQQVNTDLRVRQARLRSIHRR
jgi:DNA-binding beta-propeller fold protein YncE